LDQPWGYPAALALIVVLSAVVFRYFKRLGWL
jgi:Mg2+ and Co2+ transporter CorA